MKPKYFSALMKTVIIGLAVFGAGFYGFFMPNMVIVHFFDKPTAQQAHFVLPWIIGIALTAIPCYAVLVLAWKMAVSVQRDTQFSHKNSGRLRKIAVCALSDGVFFFLMNIVFWIDGINSPAFVVLSVLVLLAAIAFAAAAEVLSGMVEKAAVLQEENDLTI